MTYYSTGRRCHGDDGRDSVGTPVGERRTLVDDEHRPGRQELIGFRRVGPVAADRVQSDRRDAGRPDSVGRQTNESETADLSSSSSSPVVMLVAAVDVVVYSSDVVDLGGAAEEQGDLAVVDRVRHRQAADHVTQFSRIVGS